MPFQIIQCSEENLDALVEFYAEITDYLEKTVNYPKWTPGVYPGPESIGAAIRERTQYACFCQNAVIAAFVLNADPQGDYCTGDWQQKLEDGEYLVIHALAVTQKQYGKGIASRIIEYCFQKAQEEGKKALRVDVVPTNTPARSLFEKNGFAFAGEKDLNRGFEEIPLFALYEKPVTN